MDEPIDDGVGFEVDEYIANLEHDTDKFIAHLVTRLAVVTTTLEAAAVTMFGIAKINQASGASGWCQGMKALETVAEDMMAEVQKTEELMELWSIAYGQGS